MAGTIEATIYTVWDGNGRFWASDDGVEQPVGWISDIEMADWFERREEAEGFAEEIGGHVISKTEAEAADKPTPPKVVKPAASEDAEGDMPADYQCLTIAGELPPTATYPIPGQRLYYVKAPGVLQWDADNRPVSFCLMDVDILQQKGRQRADHEAYHVRELTYEEVRNLPRDQYGRPVLGGYEFAKYTSRPTPEEPGIYQVATGADGLAYWCSCLGARGHHQSFGCKHAGIVSDLAEQSAPARTTEKS